MAFAQEAYLDIRPAAGSSQLHVDEPGSCHLRGMGMKTDGNAAGFLPSGTGSTHHVMRMPDNSALHGVADLSTVEPAHFHSSE